VLLALFVVVVYSDPARPALHETFEAHSTAWLKRGAVTVHGTGRWAVDQPRGMGVEHFRFDNGSEHHDIFVLQRFDKSTQYDVHRDGKPPVDICHKATISPPMNTVWSWIKEAAYKGRATIRRVEVDLWELAAGAGVTLGVGVNTTNPNHPLWYIRKSSSESFELHFERYFHRQPNVSHFDIPKSCQTEDGWIEKDPVFPSDVVDPKHFNFSGPNGIAQALSCASGVCTCGCPYVYGGNGPCCPGKSGYDCSGLTSHCFAAGGILIPRTAASQQGSGKACVGSPQPGDLLFFGIPAHHVVMYAGSGIIYECPHTGANCHVTAVRAYDGGCRRFV